MHISNYTCSSGSDAAEVDNRKGPIYITDLENLIIALGRKFKNVQVFRFGFKQLQNSKTWCCDVYSIMCWEGLPMEGVAQALTIEKSKMGGENTYRGSISAWIHKPLLIW